MSETDCDGCVPDMVYHGKTCPLAGERVTAMTRDDWPREREIAQALLNTAEGCRITLTLLARYKDDQELESDVASMTDAEVLRMERFFRVMRRGRR